MTRYFLCISETLTGVTNRTPLERAVADILEQARLDLGLTQADIAEQAQAAGYPLTQVKVSRALRGANSLRLDDAAAIAKALGMRLSRVLQLAEREPVGEVGQVEPIREPPEGDPLPSGARRRRPRPVTAPRP